MVANGAVDSVKGPQPSCSPLALENINPKVVKAQYAVRCEHPSLTYYYRHYMDMFLLWMQSFWSVFNEADLINLTIPYAQIASKFAGAKS